MPIEPNKTAFRTDAPTIEPAALPAKQEETQQEKGNWFHRNRWFTKEPITYTGYQMFRSAMAAIPYGIGMATVHRGMGHLRIWGEKTGFDKNFITPATQSNVVAAFDEKMAQSSSLKAALAKDATKAAELTPKIEALAVEMKAAALPGRKAMVGRNIARFAGSPINQAFQIGASFTMFRFVGGLIKGQRDKVMNENNTPEQTNTESKNWWQNIKDMAKTNWTAESTGTPIAALTLGFASANFKPFANSSYKLNPGETYKQGFKRAVLHPEAKLIQNAAIWTVAYSIFFEAAERIFKDMQLKRGKWLGNSNSLKNVPDDPNVGGYAADGHTHEFHQNEPPPKPKLDILTGDPSICRFVFRRVLPVAVGITGYAVAKRSAYLKVGGIMEPITHDMAKAGSFSQNLKGWRGDAWREGAATATFGVLWMATDAWGTWYDKFFAKMQDNASHKPLDEHQAKNVAALHEKLQAKETAHGRVA